MSYLLHHILSGASLYSGAWLLIVAVGVSQFGKGRVWRVARGILAVIGAVLVAASTTPFGVVLWVAWVGAAIAWIAGEWIKPRTKDKPRRWHRVLLPVVCLLAMVIEWPHRRIPTLAPGIVPAVYIIGDSLSEGVGARGERTWPAVFAERHGARTVSLARAGATVATAQLQAGQVSEGDAVVILLIGGNDVLEGAPAARFERDLDLLLERAGGGGRRLVMFELPCPPPQSGIIAAQRRAAERHGAVLVPRRVLSAILTAPGATTDGIHLSAAGHAAVAEAVWSVVGRGVPAASR